MTLQQALCFVETARVHNFTLAAQNLFVSQSALSYSLQMLEKELGVPLFVRKKSGRKAELTEYGQAFLPYCQSAIEELEEGKEKIESLRNPAGGVVSILYSYLNCHTLIPEIFADFYQNMAYQNISVHFNVNHEKAKFEQEILSGKADLAFACTREYPGIETRPIATQELKIYMSVYHPLADKGRLRLEDIKDDVLISYYKNANLYNWILEMFRSRGIRPNISSDGREWAAHLTYVSLNQGITILPEMSVNLPNIRKIDIDHPMNHRNIYMLWAKDRELTAAAACVRKYCIRWSKSHYGNIIDTFHFS